MNSIATPQLPQTSSDEKTGDASIAYAALSFPEKFNFHSHNLLKNGVRELMRRSGLEVKPMGAYYLRFYSVGVFDVSRKDESAALSELRKTLELLGPAFAFLIATHTIKRTWTIVYGPRDGDQTVFESIFLNPEKLTEGQTQTEEEFKLMDAAFAWLREQSKGKAGG